VFWASEGIQRDGESQSALWRTLAKGGVETHVVPGNHLTMMRRSIVPTLASLLRDSLDRAHRPA
jgi:thioesterase domain-containing protein